MKRTPPPPPTSKRSNNSMGRSKPMMKNNLPPPPAPTIIQQSEQPQDNGQNPSFNVSSNDLPLLTHDVNEKTEQKIEVDPNRKTDKEQSTEGRQLTEEKVQQRERKTVENINEANSGNIEQSGQKAIKAPPKTITPNLKKAANKPKLPSKPTVPQVVQRPTQQLPSQTSEKNLQTNDQPALPQSEQENFSAGYAQKSVKSSTYSDLQSKLNRLSQIRSAVEEDSSEGQESDEYDDHSQSNKDGGSERSKSCKENESEHDSEGEMLKFESNDQLQTEKVESQERISPQNKNLDFQSDVIDMPQDGFKNESRERTDNFESIELSENFQNASHDNDAQKGDLEPGFEEQTAERQNTQLESYENQNLQKDNAFRRADQNLNPSIQEGTDKTNTQVRVDGDILPVPSPVMQDIELLLAAFNEKKSKYSLMVQEMQKEKSSFEQEEKCYLSKINNLIEEVSRKNQIIISRCQ